MLELDGRAIYRHVGIVWRKSSPLQASYLRLAGFFSTAVEREVADLAKTA